MQQHLNRNERVHGPLGVRPSVWLFVFCILLVCIIMIDRHYTEPGHIAVGEIREHESSPHLSPKVRKTIQTEVSLGASEDRARYENEEMDHFKFEQITQDRRTWVDGAVW